jgi:hypothetical protein
MLDGKAVTDRSRSPVGVELFCCNLPCLETCKRGRMWSTWKGTEFMGIGKDESIGNMEVEHRPEQACRLPPSVHGLEGTSFPSFHNTTTPP